MIKLVLTITFIMITTSTAFPHRHSQSRSNSPDLSYQKFHLRDEIHGTQYLKVEPGTNFLNLVQNSEHFDPEESSEKSRMSDITWFTGNFFTGLLNLSSISVKNIIGEGRFLSESAICFSNLQISKKNIPKNYPELEI